MQFAAYIEIGWTYKDKTIISVHDDLITVHGFYSACSQCYSSVQGCVTSLHSTPLKKGLADELEDLLTNHQHSGAVLQPCKLVGLKGEGPTSKSWIQILHSLQPS